tara:strand:- start:2268 stop:4961 length:2694 start_codon:yes stop_codon:yes gene_type:complete
MANTKVTGDLIASSTIVEGNIANSAVTGDKIANSAITSGKISGITTAHITEGSNLYYTNARADARITAADTGDLSEGSNLYYTNARADARVTVALIDEDNMSSNSATRLPSQQSVKAYVDAQILTKDNTDEIAEGSSNLYYTDARADARVTLIIDSAPSTLNTLNELAAALGDDANFSTTVTNSIATKLPLAGGTMTGVTQFNDHTNYGDQVYARFGASQDLQIYHDGSNSYIKDTGTGNLEILADSLSLLNAAGSEYYARFYTNGAAYLYHNGVATLNTSGTGVTLTGALSISGDGSNAVTFTESGAGIMTIAAPDDIILDAVSDIVLDAGGADIRFKDGGTEFGRINNNSSGNFLFLSPISDKDIIFKGNDGGSEFVALTLDMSAGGNATFAKEITAGDDIGTPTKIVIGEGASPELRLKKTDAGHAKISFYNNPGSSAQAAYISLDAAEDFTYYGASGVDQVFYAGGALNLTLSGTTASFAGQVVPGEISMGDGKKILLGNGDDFQIYHVAGSNSYIEEHGEGALVFKSNDYYFQSTASATALQITPGGTANFAGAINVTNTGTSTFSGAVNVDNMLAINIDDISTGENRGLKLYNENSSGQQWNLTAGRAGQENTSFVIRDASNDVDAIIINEQTAGTTPLITVVNGGATTFSGDINRTNPGSGDAKITIKSTTGGDPSLVFNSAAANRNGSLRFQDNGTQVGEIRYVHNGDALEFHTGGASGSAHQELRLKESEGATFRTKVGIGKAPTAKHTMTDAQYVQEWVMAKGFYQYTTQTGSAAGNFTKSTVINTNNLRGLTVDYYESGHYFNNGNAYYFRHTKLYILLEGTSLRVGTAVSIQSLGNRTDAIVTAPAVTCSGAHEITITSTILSGFTHYLSVDVVGSGFDSFESIS